MPGSKSAGACVSAASDGVGASHPAVGMGRCDACLMWPMLSRGPCWKHSCAEKRRLGQAT